MLADLPLEQRLHVQGLLVDLHSKLDERGLKMTVPGELLFAVNSEDIQDGAYDTLAKVAELIDIYDRHSVRIIGHTDAVGDAAYNKSSRSGAPNWSSSSSSTSRARRARAVDRGPGRGAPDRLQRHAGGPAGQPPGGGPDPGLSRRRRRRGAAQVELASGARSARLTRDRQSDEAWCGLS